MAKIPSIKILLIEHRDEYRAIYGLNLVVYLNAEVEVVRTKSEAIKILKEQTFTLIFIDNNAYTTDLSYELYTLMSQKKLKTPLYVVGKSQLQSIENVYRFDTLIELRHILGPMAENLQVTAKMMAEKINETYFAIPVKFLIPGWQCSTDLFEKSNGTLTTIFKVEDVMSQERLSQLTLGNVEYLYVESNKRIKFVNCLTSEIFAKLNDPTLSADERIHYTANAFQMAMEQARRLGITQSTLDLANSCIESMENIVRVYPTINALFDSLNKQDNSYCFKHSLLINYIGSHILKKVAWGSKEEQLKMSFAAFFHDIVLTDDKYCRIKTDEELELKNLSNHDRQLIQNHALHAADLVAKADKIPYGVDVVLRQHHGSKSGKFLSKLSGDITPMAVVFVLAEEWATLVIENSNSQKRIQKKEIIQRMVVKYDFNIYRKIIPILHTLEI